MTGVRAFLRRHAAALAAGAASVAWLAFQVGPGILDPRRVGWLLWGDWSPNYVGWTFFRSAPWTLPLGANPGFPDRIGSFLAFSDSLPLLAVLFKPLSPILPADFQYVGPWLGLCFALQGFAGAKLVSIATRSRAAQALGGTLFGLAPPLLHRIVGPRTGHASLTGHWIVLAALWIALAPCDDARAARRRAGWALALVLLASGIHPYLVMMAAALSAAFVVRAWAIDRLVGRGAAAAGVGAVAAAAAVGLLAFGYLSPGVAVRSWGFGRFSADLLSLLAPMGWSRAWTGLPVGKEQYEGFSYLGLGVILLGVGAASIAVARRGLPAGGLWRRAVPAAIAAAVMALYALSFKVTLAGKPLLDLDVPGPLAVVTETFRSSGRFVWPLHYLAIAAAVLAVAVALRDRPRALAGVLGAAVLVQLADVRPPIDARMEAGPPELTEIGVWRLARGPYHHVVLDPPLLVAGGAPVAPEACGKPPYASDVITPLADLAYRLGATFNSAYLARLDPARAAVACTEAQARLARGELDPETIYVVHGAVASRYVTAGATCANLDGIPVCVRGDRDDPFARSLRAGAAR